MKLYGYFRSSAAYRVRIALGLKGLSCEQAAVHLVKDGGQQFSDAYRALNPQSLVPALEDGGVVLSQSLAIIEYLDETHPQPPLLPPDAAGRARVRSLALAIACDIHPLNNLRVLRYLKTTLGAGDEAKDAWYRHWIMDGFTALEARLSREAETGRYCHGDAPGMADAVLVPQVFNAERFDCDLTAFPTLRRINAACLDVPAFQAAHPARQPDAE